MPPSPATRRPANPIPGRPPPLLGGRPACPRNTLWAASLMSDWEMGESGRDDVGRVRGEGGAKEW